MLKRELVADFIALPKYKVKCKIIRMYKSILFYIIPRLLIDRSANIRIKISLLFYLNILNILFVSFSTSK